MTTMEIQHWTALYLATGIACGLAATLSALALICQILKERSSALPDSWTAGFRVLLHLWWRWQKLYWLATPVILAIVIGFAASLEWS